MKIKSVTIKNYKSFDADGIEISFENLTGLIGENSTGKSNVLSALDIFFNFSQPKINKNTFFHQDISKEISIKVRFHELSPEEIKTFKLFLNENGELEVEQKIVASIVTDEGEEPDDKKEAEFKCTETKYCSKLMSSLDWADLKKPTKANLKDWWKNELKINDFDFKSLFDSEEQPTQEVYLEKLTELWDKHFDIIPKEIVMGTDSELGLNKFIKTSFPYFLYIPAVRKVSDEFKVNKSNPFGLLISWLSADVSKEANEKYQQKLSELLKDALTEMNSKIQVEGEEITKLDYLKGVNKH